MTESRTQKSLKNAKVALVFSVLTFILGFFSRKILLVELGTDILGLYTTAFNLCGFLNLAELGITSAVAFSLYKPLFSGDRDTITEIVSIQGWLFRFVGYAMTIGAVVMMLFFNVFFNEEKTNLPLWYPYATFGVVFLSQVLGYFFCYQQTLLFADQKTYVNTLCLQGGRCLKMFLQIAGIGFCGFGYKFWLAVELACGVLSLLWLNYAIKKAYPWLHDEPGKGKLLIRKHGYILKKVGQLVFHKISVSVIDKVTPVIVYALLSLRMVAIYGNYLMIITNISVVVEMCFNSLNASVGNLVAEGNKTKILEFFSGHKAFRYWLVSVICFGLYFLLNPFMELWMGEEYVFDEVVVALFVLYTFISNTCTCGTFLNAYGQFDDIWAPVAEAVINIGLSLWLGSLFGVKGILLGIIISLWIIFTVWKPYFLYTRSFKTKPSEYVMVAARPFLAIVAAWGVATYAINALNLCYADFVQFTLSAVIITAVYGTVSLTIMYIFVPTFRQIIKRLFPRSGTL